MAGRDDVKALVFDIFGTVVDWRTSCSRELAAFGRGRGITGVDWEAFTDDWRGLYQPSMEEVRSGRREFAILDDLHRESLLALVQRYNLPSLANHEVEHLVTIWHRLSPWPDVVEGLYRLKKRYIIGTLSNGNIGLMTRLAKHAGLPWDCILGAEVARAYKPQPEAYIRTAKALNLEPRECMLVAAHNGDLQAASDTGYRTAFVIRPTEYGPNQVTDKGANKAWDVITDSFGGVADAMGCPRY
ncbi:MAG TPA: haloacid dehalogenase type II [Hyphomicrobiaceae bacterium]|nr:haloacid dehalogenase type II [Hyphomicrobiaceae bacterium]